MYRTVLNCPVKTPLHKLIPGTPRPPQGTIHTRGRIAALLSLGAGFHPELTGRENVYLNASILGLSRAGTDQRFEERHAKSGLEEFLYTPVKCSSSGV